MSAEFSKEDMAAWNASEIAKEFERIAAEKNLLNGPPPEAYLPIDEEEKEMEKSWEEETDEERLEDAAKEILNEEEKLPEEVAFASTKLLNNLQKLADAFVDKRRIKEAFCVERAILQIKNALGGN